MPATYIIYEDSENGYCVDFHVGSSQFRYFKDEIEEAVDNGICCNIGGDKDIFRILLDELKERGLLPH